MSTRGRLRIYLGAAPGVGKTFAMLDEGHRRRARGTDVVVGVVETHGRARTAERLEGLEVVPRRRVEHRGVVLDELDVEAVMARAPEVVLVDELAHSDAATGGRRRWEDIDVLLDAGIDVVSTLNVQHLESLNDVVESITGARQQETVPDAWVRAAEQVELVDMSPEALRRRLAHGNVYPMERVDAALANWFRVGNLSALRELALLWVADQVDDGLASYRRQHGIDERWETRERVVVALTGAPGGDHLVRRAARMALRSHGELIGVHVRRDDGMASGPGEELGAHRELLGELGGRYVEVAGADVGRALLAAARAENGTQLVLGASRRSWWARVVEGSVIDRVLRDAGALDVHVIPTPPTGATPLRLPRPPRSLVPARRRAIGFGIGVLGPVLLSAALLPLRNDELKLDVVLLLFLSVSVAAAAIGGTGPAVVAATVAFVLADIVFVAPTGRLSVSQPADVAALVCFASVTGLVAWFVGVSARRTAEATRARAEAATLGRIAEAGDDGEARLQLLLDHLRDAFDLPGATLFARPPGGTWAAVAAAGERPPAGPDDGAGTVLPVGGAADGREVVLALAGPALAAEDRAVVSAFAAQLGGALDARGLAASAARATELDRVAELRASLLSAVSHDLRTPLATIKASVTSLLADDVEWSSEEREEFLRSVDAETDRLAALVADLLDMSRISAGAIQPSSRPVGAEEVVLAAVASLGDRVGPEAVVVDIDESLPSLRTDPGVLERVVANLVANAVQWSPPGSPVRVRADVLGPVVEVRVVDTGPGIAPDERERVVQPFQRLGDAPGGTGVGLGLAVARGLTEALGGSLEIDDTPGGGTTMVVRLPREPAVAPSAPPGSSEPVAAP